MVEAEMTESTGAAGPRGRRKIVLIVVAATAVLIAVAAVGWKSLAHRPLSPGGDPVAIAKFAATADFAQLSLEQKAQYLQTLRAHMPELVAAAKSGKLTREERVAALRNGFKAGARVEMRNYFSLPAGPSRQAYLDKLIDEQEWLRGYASQAKEGGRVSSGGGLALKQFAESLPPGERVQMAQFGFDLFKRRQERGLPILPHGR
jgi:hypothetical protein